MYTKRNVGGKLLCCGYTTGACAAAAAKAATLTLLGGAPAATVAVCTPGGISLSLDICDIEMSADSVRCAVQKDSGDDPDVTNGILVYADVNKAVCGICIDGGDGVGRVTKPGLDQPVGAAAINSVPRQMIADAVKEACASFGYEGGISVTISIPGGEAIAQRTFNPRMGIEGGLSVIGTTGIVEPMSNKALIETIRLELNQLYAGGAREVLFTPGNYGETFARDKLRLSPAGHIVCSNFIGDAIDAAVELGFTKILLIGHIGKLVKLGIGVTNTHSAFGDGRMETLIACALEAGGRLPLLKAIAESVTTDAALGLLHDAALLDKTMLLLGGRIDACLKRRVSEGVSIGFVCFTNAEPFNGILCQSVNAEELMQTWRSL